MIVHDVEQGSEAWLKLRLGIPTASDFHKIVTPTGKLSAQSKAYANRLIAESLLGYPLDSLDGLPCIERGKDLEAEAVRLYEFTTGNTADVVGFCTTDDGQIGASPDRLVGECGQLEIKCPSPQTHVGYLRDGIDTAYMPQIQGQMAVTGRKWCDFFSYHPSMPPVRVRVERDETYIEKLSEALAAFNAERLIALESIRDLGRYAEREAIASFEQGEPHA